MPLDYTVVQGMQLLASQGLAEAEQNQDMPLYRRNVQEFEEKAWQLLGLDGPEVPIREVTIPVAGQPDLLLRLHYPPGQDPQNAAGANLPLVLSFFGGAFRQGGIDGPGFREIYKFRAAGAGVIVAAVSYALAPEHPWPAAAEQGYAALDWVHSHAEEIGARSDRIAVAGASSGANLAAVSTLINQDRAQHPIAVQILEVPVLDLSRADADLSMLEEIGVDTQAAEGGLRQAAEDYLPRAEDRSHRYASPLLVEDLSGLPPAYIFTAEYDPLRVDGEAYAARLLQAGVPTYCVRGIGQTHTSGGNLKISLYARGTNDFIIDVLRGLHR